MNFTILNTNFSSFFSYFFSWEYLAFYVGQSLNLLSKCEADEAEKVRKGEI